jgi:hypothetical protein
MPAPWLPPLVHEIGRRSFAFYPSIANAEPNEWLIRSASWTVVEVVNARTGLEVAVPRHFVGPVSEVDDPILIVGLTKELEYREGAVWPRVKRVIEMPRAVNGGVVADLPPWRAQSQSAGPTPVVAIRLHGSAESRLSKVVAAVEVGAVVVSLLSVGVFREWMFPPHVMANRNFRRDLLLSGSDDYASLLRRFGNPDSDRWVGAGSAQFRTLRYDKLRATLVLMNRGTGPAHYIGAMDSNWRVVHSIRLENQIDSTAVLSKLPRF